VEEFDITGADCAVFNQRVEVQHLVPVLCPEQYGSAENRWLLKQGTE
jgi:hypothetical protein